MDKFLTAPAEVFSFMRSKFSAKLGHGCAKFCQGGGDYFYINAIGGAAALDEFRLLHHRAVVLLLEPLLGGGIDVNAKILAPCHPPRPRMADGRVIVKVKLYRVLCRLALAHCYFGTKVFHVKDNYKVPVFSSLFVASELLCQFF